MFGELFQAGGRGTAWSEGSARGVVTARVRATGARAEPGSGDGGHSVLASEVNVMGSQWHRARATVSVPAREPAAVTAHPRAPLFLVPWLCPTHIPLPAGTAPSRELDETFGTRAAAGSAYYAFCPALESLAVCCRYRCRENHPSYVIHCHRYRERPGAGPCEQVYHGTNYESLRRRPSILLAACRVVNLMRLHELFVFAVPHSRMAGRAVN